MIYAIVLVKRDPGKLNTLLSGMKGILGADLYTVSFDQISAVVSDTKRADLIVDQANAIAFAEVIEKLALHFTLLPMRFGSIMESNDAIAKMLARNYPEIQQNLQKVENKVEFGLKVFCDSETLRSEMKAKSIAATRTPSNTDAEIKNSVFRDYVNKKLETHRIEELLLNYVDAVIASTMVYLSRLNAIHKFKKMATETTIIDAVFLLEKERKDALIQAIADLQSQYSGLKFILTGPWPPYNFVETAIK